MAQRGGKARQRARKRKRSTSTAPDAAAIERRLTESIQHIEAGDLAGAARRLAALARQAPRHAEVRHALGYVLHRRGRRDAAIAALTEAVDLDPATPSHRNSLGIVLHEAGQCDEAVEQLRQAAVGEPGNPIFQFNLGNALKDCRRFEEAAECYRKALAILPDDPEILNNLGIVLTRLGAATAAIGLFRQAAALRPQDPQIPYNLGLAYQEAGDTAAALACLRASLDVDESHDRAVAAIAQLHANRGEAAKAIATYRRYLEMCPDDHGAMRALAELLRAARNFGEARYWIERIADLAPEDPAAARMIGGILAEENDVDGAVAVFRRIVDRHPDQSEVWLDLAHLHLLLERFDDARECIAMAAAADPAAARLFYLRSLLAEAEGDLGRAGALQDECLRRDPDNLVMRTHRGRLHLAAGELEDGLRLHDARYDESSGAIGDLPAPLWRGEPLAGKRLLIAAEQGVGDEIIFGSCIPDAIRAAGHCIIECDPRLVPLFARSFPEARVCPSQKSVDNRFNVRSYGWLSADEMPDYAVPAGSLARWFRRSLADFPGPGGYLKLDPERVAHWRRRLDALGPGLKVGLCWRSSLAGPERNRFYTDVDAWAPVFSEPGLVPVNLQYDDCQAELDQVRSRFGVAIHRMPDLDLYNDFDNTAAMMRALDVVVSVSTVMPCLAAAAGRRSMAVSIGRCWTLLGTDTYPWLPDLRPMIRPPGEDWSLVIGRTLRRLRMLKAGCGAVRAA